MIVAATNCIAYETKIDPSKLYRSQFHHSLLTDALLRLFKGETLQPATETDHRYHFKPIDLKTVDAIVWTPFIDQAGYYPNTTNYDGKTYPYSDPEMCKKYGISSRVPLEVVFTWWTELHQITKNIPKKIILIYPSTFLTDETPTKKQYKERIEESTIRAKQIFNDWTLLSVTHPVQSGNWWAHFTVESRRNLLDELENILST